MLKDFHFMRWLILIRNKSENGDIMILVKLNIELPAETYEPGALGARAPQDFAINKEMSFSF